MGTSKQSWINKLALTKMQSHSAFPEQSADVNHQYLKQDILKPTLRLQTLQIFSGLPWEKWRGLWPMSLQVGAQSTSYGQIHAGHSEITKGSHTFPCHCIWKDNWIKYSPKQHRKQTHVIFKIRPLKSTEGAEEWDQTCPQRRSAWNYGSLVNTYRL